MYCNPYLPKRQFAYETRFQVGSHPPSESVFELLEVSVVSDGAETSSVEAVGAVDTAPEPDPEGTFTVVVADPTIPAAVAQRIVNEVVLQSGGVVVAPLVLTTPIRMLLLKSAH